MSKINTFIIGMIIPDPIYLFRMVHLKNIPYILRYGICAKDHELCDPDYIPIGHQKLIVDRQQHPIPITGYGCLGEYIPFYFWGHSPMLYMIMNGYQGVVQHPQEDIVYIVINSEHIITAQLPYLFTDRHAKRKITNFFNNPKDFIHLRWDVIVSKDWRNTDEDIQRMEFKQAEFLIRGHIPTNFIDKLVVKNEKVRLEIENIVRNLGLTIPIVVAREGKLYY